MGGHALKHTNYIWLKGAQELDRYFEESPGRKLSCDQNAEKTMLVHKEVSDPIFENKENGTLGNFCNIC